MDLDNTENEWKNEVPALSAIRNSNPFSVPENYFKNTAELIKARITIENSRFDIEEEFQIPENYFDLLSENIKSRITLESLKQDVNNGGFAVPDGYFESLNHNIISRMDESAGKSPVKVRKLFPAWAKYAAAASITAVIGFVAFLNLNQSPNLDKQLGKVPEQEIINYLQVHTDEGDTPAILENLGQNVDLAELNKEISPEDLEFYINTTL
ncbi:hypothetical protein [Daejeonella oryzae]|uniref:hypothetical protein n=1 Tax=Daejeonella oryzae TaxID=1122943 RepID=UPI0003FEDD96|nr:hypothetical protein [Daejeonella oryzae]